MKDFQLFSTLWEKGQTTHHSDNPSDLCLCFTFAAVSAHTGSGGPEKPQVHRRWKFRELLGGRNCSQCWQRTPLDYLRFCREFCSHWKDPKSQPRQRLTSTGPPGGEKLWDIYENKYGKCRSVTFKTIFYKKLTFKSLKCSL